MKIKILLISLILVFTIDGNVKSVLADAEYVPGELLIKFKSGATPSDIDNALSSNSMAMHSTIGLSKLYKVALDATYSVPEMLERLKDHPDIVYAEPNYRVYLFKSANDLHSNQWGLKNTGQTLTCPACFGDSSGSSGSDIDIESGWDITTGSASTIIAIIDTGIDLDHPDLDGNIVAGFDFVNNDAIADDDYGHGTHVAGIAAAEGNNGIGVAGVCWNCKLMPIKAFNSSGAGDVAGVVSSINFAIDNGADVINMSYGSTGRSQSEEDALISAYNKGIVSVCATGNSNNDVSFPAAYDRYCIAVGATDVKDNKAEFSSFGPEIDVAAPGVDIYSTAVVGGATACDEETSGSGYGFCSGTSMATPFVSGLAALIISKNPTYTQDQVLLRILQTAQDVNNKDNAGFDEFMGMGRVKAAPASLDNPSISVDGDTGFCFISFLR